MKWDRAWPSRANPDPTHHPPPGPPSASGLCQGWWRALPHPPLTLHAHRQECLGKMLLFNHLDDDMQNQIVGDMYERRIGAGEILIREGDTGGCCAGRARCGTGGE